MPDPVARPQVARDEIDRVFGKNYAKEHPDVVITVMAGASSDWAASTVALALHEVAAALVEPEPVVLDTRGLIGTANNFTRRR